MNNTLSDTLRHIHQSTPLTDKAVVVGAAMVASLQSHIHGIAQTLIVICTLLVLIPRVIIGWRDLLRDNKDNKTEDDEQP